MPIYEYACNACNHQFEAIQKISDEPLQRCPACGKDSLHKLISSGGIRLRGESWKISKGKAQKLKPKNW